jgi:hypothetical protein
MFNVNLETSDPAGKPLKVEWIIQPEQHTKLSAGEEEPVLPELTEPIVKGDEKHAEIKAPKEPGAYRVFAYVRNGGGVAVANVPFRVEAPK